MSRSNKPPRAPKEQRKTSSRNASSLDSKRKGVGNPSGHRQQVAASAHVARQAKKTPDPRVGSRKPVPLLGQVGALPTEHEAAVAALLALEADARFNALLDKVDDGVRLEGVEKLEFETFIARHEALMALVGDDAPEGDD